MRFGYGNLRKKRLWFQIWNRCDLLKWFIIRTLRLRPHTHAECADAREECLASYSEPLALTCCLLRHSPPLFPTYRHSSTSSVPRSKRLTKTMTGSVFTYFVALWCNGDGWGIGHACRVHGTNPTPRYTARNLQFKTEPDAFHTGSLTT